jgi:transcriptional regulator with XRE-family HTH domain
MLTLGFNQTRLAQASAVSVATIRKLQKGADQSYEAATLYRLADVLGWDPQEFVRRASGEPSDADLLRRSNSGTTYAPLSGKWERLTDADKAAVEAIVDRLLDDE